MTQHVNQFLCLFHSTIGKSEESYPRTQMCLRCSPRAEEVEGEDEEGEEDEIFLFRSKHVEFPQTSQAAGYSKERFSIHGPISPY